MERQALYVDKQTGTPADTLLAFGVADLLKTVLTRADVWLEDVGDSYRVEFSAETNWHTQAPFQHLCPGLNTAKKKSPIGHAVNYLDEQQRNQRYYDALKKGEDVAAQGIAGPHRDWPVWAIINQMSAIGGYHKMLELWDAHKPCFAELLLIVNQMFGDRPNRIAEAEAEWKKLAKQHGIKGGTLPRLQVVNPSMGKGGNSAKASRLGIGGLKGFWLLEYLKFAGFYRAALPRTVSGVKDRKTYIVVPKRLSLRQHTTTFQTFQASFYASSAIKMDILAVLRYCQTFVEQWRDGQARESKRRYRSGKPSDYVAALETIFYKHLGSAHATLNLSTLILPDWTRQITTRAEADQLLALLEEHQWIIYPLKENQGDAHKLLQFYRRFLSGRELRAFFSFCRLYGSYVMSEYARKNRPKILTTTNLEVLMSNHPKSNKLTPIITNTGFVRIAAAIRASTINPQYFKSIGKPGPYEIRYGLGQDLMRNATYPNKFITALSKFSQAYMQENGRINERYKGKPPVNRTQIREDDLSEIIMLIDQYGSETVASLLVAFGYANKPSDKNKEQE